MKEIYASSPKEKRREKAIVAVLGILGILLFLCSRIPGILFPALLQVLAVLCFAIAIFLISGFLLKEYTYAIAPRDHGDAAPWDLTVTELCRGRRTVVARIALSEIRSVRRVTKENRETLREELRGKRVFSYTGVLTSDSLVCIGASVGGEDIFVKIVAEEAFLQALSM